MPEWAEMTTGAAVVTIEEAHCTTLQSDRALGAEYLWLEYHTEKKHDACLLRLFVWTKKHTSAQKHSGGVRRSPINGIMTMSKKCTTLYMGSIKNGNRFIR